MGKVNFEDELKRLYAEEEKEILKNAYVLIHMINFDEPFGLGLVESMACGTPVTANPRGAIPEIIDNQKTGLKNQTIVCQEDSVLHWDTSFPAHRGDKLH